MTAIIDAPSGAAMTLASAEARLATLDLSMLRMKIADPVEGKGWSEGQLDLAEQEYRRFLALHLMYPESEIVPCELVDEMWHAHILDTMAYADDCKRIFGFFLHHFPYFGLRGPEDAANLETAYDATLERYAATFGEPPQEVWSPAEAMKCVRKACKPQKCK